jgi:subtilisin family serine protease
MKFINKKTFIFSGFCFLCFLIIHTLNLYYFIRNNNILTSNQTSNQEITENYHYLSENLDKMKANTDYKESEIVIKFKIKKIDLNKFSLFDEQLKKHFFSKLNDLESLSEIKNLNTLVFKSENEKIESLIDKFKNNNLVEYVEPNYLFKFARETEEEEKGDWTQLNPWWVEKIKLKDSWNLEQEKTDTQEVLVAILDQGVDYNHPNLIPNMYNSSNCQNENNKKIKCPHHGWNFIQHNDNPLPNFSLPFHKHGTSVAGVIAGVTDVEKNTTGFSSKNNLKVMSLVVGEEQASLQAGIDAIYFAQNNHAKVINASWGSPHPNLTLKKAIQDFDGIFVTASMNDGENNDNHPMFPCNFQLDNLICVGSINQKNQLSDFSNYSKKFVHLVAPGENILTTTPNNSYEMIDGTSIAAPQVAGLAALIHSYNPFLSNQNVRNIILETGNTLPNLKSKTITGKVINSLAALQKASQINQKYQIQANQFYLYLDKITKDNIPTLTINNKVYNLKNSKTTMRGIFEKDPGSAFIVNLDNKIKISDYSQKNKKNKFRKTIPKNLFTLFSNNNSNQEFNFLTINNSGQKYEINLHFPKASNAQLFVPLEKNLSLKEKIQTPLSSVPKTTQIISLKNPINFGFNQFKKQTQPNNIDLLFLENGFIIEVNHNNKNGEVNLKINDKKIYEAVYNHGNARDEQNNLTKGSLLINVAPDNINTIDYIDENNFSKKIPENFYLSYQSKADQKTEEGQFLEKISYEVNGISISGYLSNQAEIKIYLPQKSIESYQPTLTPEPEEILEKENLISPTPSIIEEKEDTDLINTLEIKNLTFSPEFNKNNKYYEFEENQNISDLTLFDLIINSNFKNNETSLHLQKDEFEIKIKNQNKIENYIFKRKQTLWYN